MTLRFKPYGFYSRIWLYQLPLLTFLAAAYARFYDLRLHPLPISHNNGFYIISCLLTTVIWCIAAEHNRLFDIDELFKENTGIHKVSAAVGSTYLIVVCILFFYRQQEMSRLFFAASAIILFSITLGSRMCFRALLRGRHLNKPVRVLIVGADAYALKLAARMAKIPFAPSEVVAHLRLPGQDARAEAERVYEFEYRENWIRLVFDEIVIALPPARLDVLAGLVKQLEPLHVPICTVLDFGDAPIVRDRLFQLGDLQFLDLATTPLESPAYFILKRAFDVVFSLLAIAFMAPLFLVIALAIKLTSDGPVLFRQERVGLNGRIFTIFKFRTMRVTTLDVSDETFTKKDDPRRTNIGAFLRKASLDELPQFFNVLRGDMSVVGPRPERPFYVKKFGQEVLNYDTRHRLKVGITGWAQVNGWRGDTSIEKRIEADLYYLQNWSFTLDLRIVALTILRGFTAEHAY